MVGIDAPSIRLKALRLPPSSRIATFSVTPSSLAFATAAFTIFCASSEEMLCFFTTLAIGHLPLFGSIYRYPQKRNWQSPDGEPMPLGRLLSATSARITLFRPMSVCVGSGIHSAINGQIRPGNVRGLRTGDERHHRSDFINMPITVERCGGLLRHRPVARSGLQIPGDRPWLDVVDRDTPTPYLSGQRLSKHLHGSLRGRVRYQSGRCGT